MYKVLEYKSGFQTFCHLLGAFFGLVNCKAYNSAWFWTIVIYICVNYFNSSLVDGRIEARVILKSRS